MESVKFFFIAEVLIQCKQFNPSSSTKLIAEKKCKEIVDEIVNEIRDISISEFCMIIESCIHLMDNRIILFKSSNVIFCLALDMINHLISNFARYRKHIGFIKRSRIVQKILDCILHVSSIDFATDPHKIDFTPDHLRVSNVTCQDFEQGYVLIRLFNILAGLAIHVDASWVRSTILFNNNFPGMSKLPNNIFDKNKNARDRGKGITNDKNIKDIDVKSISVKDIKDGDDRDIKDINVKGKDDRDIKDIKDKSISVKDIKNVSVKDKDISVKSVSVKDIKDKSDRDVSVRDIKVIGDRGISVRDIKDVSTIDKEIEKPINCNDKHKNKSGKKDKHKNPIARLIDIILQFYLYDFNALKIIDSITFSDSIKFNTLSTDAGYYLLQLIIGGKDCDNINNDDERDNTIIKQSFLKTTLVPKLCNLMLSSPTQYQVPISIAILNQDYNKNCTKNIRIIDILINLIDLYPKKVTKYILNQQLEEIGGHLIRLCLFTIREKNIMGSFTHLSYVLHLILQLQYQSDLFRAFLSSRNWIRILEEIACLDSSQSASANNPSWTNSYHGSSSLEEYKTVKKQIVESLKIIARDNYPHLLLQYNWHNLIQLSSFRELLLNIYQWNKQLTGEMVHGSGLIKSLTPYLISARRVRNRESTPITRKIDILLKDYINNWYIDRQLNTSNEIDTVWHLYSDKDLFNIKRKKWYQYIHMLINFIISPQTIGDDKSNNRDVKSYIQFIVFLELKQTILKSPSQISFLHFYSERINIKQWWETISLYVLDSKLRLFNRIDNLRIKIDKQGKNNKINNVDEIKVNSIGGKVKRKYRDEM